MEDVVLFLATRLRKSMVSLMMPFFWVRSFQNVSAALITSENHMLQELFFARFAFVLGAGSGWQVPLCLEPAMGPAQLTPFEVGQTNAVWCFRHAGKSQRRKL